MGLTMFVVHGHVVNRKGRISVGHQGQSTTVAHYEEMGHNFSICRRLEDRLENF